MLSAADHAALDQQLLGLLPLLDNQAQHAAAQLQARNILEGVVGAGLLPGGDPAGLLRSDWEQHWRSREEVSWAWFCGMSAARALHAAVTEMVRFVLGGATPHSRQKYAGQLAAALRDYLDGSGHQVQPPRPVGYDRLSFDDATWTVTLDGVPYVVGDHQAYRLFRIIAEHKGAAAKRDIAKMKIGVNGRKTAPDLLKKLPPGLQAAVVPTPRGYCLRLPPLP
jgi:hypothetical protein